MAITPAGSGTNFNSIGLDSSQPKFQNISQKQQETFDKINPIWDKNIQSSGITLDDQSKLKVKTAIAANVLKESGAETGVSNTKNEDSHGLYQMNRSGGAGKGYSVEELKDPVKSSEIFFKVEKKAFTDLFQAAANGKTLSQLTAQMTEKIERPSNSSAKGQERAKEAEKIKPLNLVG